MSIYTGTVPVEKVIVCVRRELSHYVATYRKLPDEKKRQFAASLNGKALMSPKQLADIGISHGEARSLPSQIGRNLAIRHALDTLSGNIVLKDARHRHHQDHRPPELFLQLLTTAR